MSPRQKRGFWRTCRVYFRRIRITGWLLILALIGCLVYVDQIGLPRFAKQTLLQKLHARGIDLQFSRLRLSWFRGILAENVRFGRADAPTSPELTASEMRLQLNHRGLARLQFQVDSLFLSQGRLVWPIAETNRPPRQLSLTNIQTELRLLPNDEWVLDNFKADFAGATFHLSGIITNASAIREWGALHAKPGAPAGLWQSRVRQLADTLDTIHFSGPPEFLMVIRGDARDLQSFNIRLFVGAPGADTPWGTLEGGRLAVRLLPAASNETARAELVLETAGARTRWATTTNLQLVVRAASIDGQTNLVHCDMVLTAAHVQTEWAGATNVQFEAQWVHALTNPIPLAAQGQLACEQAATKWASAQKLHLLGHLTTPPVASPAFPPGWPASPVHPFWTWWTNLQPYLLTWECRLDEIQSRNFAMAEVACGGNWCAPELTLTNLHAKLYQGKLVHPARLEVNADLNVATRRLNASVDSSVDPHEISQLLPEAGQQWLAQCSWAKPPLVKGEVSLVLPAWTNGQADWRAEVQPTLRLAAELKLDQGGVCRGVPFTAAQSHLAYSNLCLAVPDLAVTRPEGRLAAEHLASDRSGDFYWRFSSTIDPLVLRPLLGTNEQDTFDLFTFTRPPVVEAEFRGRSHDPDRAGLRGSVALTNFTFRGESFTGVQTAFQYTNNLLQFFAPRVQRGQQRASADGLAADFKAQLVYLTNGFSTTEPLVIAGAIGAHVARAIQPYQFERPPTAHVHGTIPMHGEEGADLVFELDGGPFHWSKFNLPHITGTVHWSGEELTLSDVRGDFYGGRLSGGARFQFHPGAGTDIRFAATTTNTQFHLLMADVSSATNKLEGLLSGSLSITNGNTAAPQLVFGYGHLVLRDGLIWDIPLFGIFSPVLDGLVPGLGSSRANAGTCTFVITNSVIRSEDLEIRASTMRLQYRGTVDFDQRVNAKVEAELLRDMWLVGPVVSTVFTPVTKLFEYKVTGTLDQPKLAPVFFIGKVILLPFQLPFHPVRTLKGLFPEDTSHTNSPPVRQ